LAELIVSTENVEIVIEAARETPKEANMPALATLVVTATLASAPFAAQDPNASNHLVEANFGGGGESLSDIIDSALSSGSIGQGNGNGNGNVGSLNGNNNSGNNNGNGNVGTNNGNNNSGNNNGNENTGNNNGNDNSSDDNGNGNVGDDFGNDNTTNGNGNNNIATDRIRDDEPGVTRELRSGAAPGGVPANGVIVCQRVRFLWMTELRCN